MSRQDEQEGVAVYPLQAMAIQAAISGLEDSYGSITELHWEDRTTGQIITQAAVGQQIVLVASWTATVPTSGISWKACVTAMEAGTIPVVSAWKNYVQANTTGPNSSTKTNMKLDQMGASLGGTLIMPNRALTVVVKLWVRGDLVQDYPPVSEAWRS